MKELKEKSILLNCFKCKGTKFEFNNDYTWAKCSNCNKTYKRGFEELKEFNKKKIEEEIQLLVEESTIEILNDLVRILESQEFHI